jgi:hypothetical protein
MATAASPKRNPALAEAYTVHDPDTDSDLEIMAMVFRDITIGGAGRNAEGLLN